MDKAFFIGEDSVILMDTVLAVKEFNLGNLRVFIDGGTIDLTGNDAENFLKLYKDRANKINAVTLYKYEQSGTQLIVDQYSADRKLVKPAFDIMNGR